MGKKGDKLTSDSTTAAEYLVNSLADIKGITSKKMFGGHGIFCDGKMFGIVNSKGECFFKVNEDLKETYENKGSAKHGKMPYFSIPEDILDNKNQLVEWAKWSIAINQS